MSKKPKDELKDEKMTISSVMNTWVGPYLTAMNFGQKSPKSRK